MSKCDCTSFEYLELARDAINNRVLQAKSLRARLESIAEHSANEHVLFRCRECGQYWQRSLAWNWGNKEYLFRVPAIEASDWAEEPFVQPDELLVFDAAMRQFLKKQSNERTDRICKRDGCAEHAVKLSAFCLSHHIENLQKVHLLHQSPTGRWFEPYHVQCGTAPT
jgi:hypothetical protein